MNDNSAQQRKVKSGMYILHKCIAILGINIQMLIKTTYRYAGQ